MVRTLFTECREDFDKLEAASHAAAKIDEEHIYQESNPITRKYMDGIMDSVLLPGSGLGKVEHFHEFYDAVTTGGKSGLILMEHYSNMDLPAIVYFLSRSSEAWQQDFSRRIVAVAGMKLNEENPFVRALAEAFTRIVIYPTRSLTKAEAVAQTDEERQAEEKRARKINLAAMHAVSDCKKRQEVVLVFPSGTRYRPGKAETRRGLREVDSYIRLFDVMLLVAINGNCLRINPADPDNMMQDMLVNDKLVLTASEVIECKSFRKGILDALSEGDADPKQHVIDRVMEILAATHDEVERTRLQAGN